MKTIKKTAAIILSMLLTVSAAPLTAFAAGEAVTITEDGAYTVNSCESLTIDGAKATVTLSDAEITGTGRSAVIVKNGAEVTFVLEGENVIKGDEEAFSCGIEVEYGSDIIIEGSGSLDVTGGKWGAGIGSYGTTINIPEEERVQVGTITINSGNITAHAGARGSGIGSGYHVNGNLITINGGTVYAYGKECGAGIGSGYGTSGGAIGVAAVGEYDAGKIVINGGEVYAAANYTASFDCNDLAALNANDPCSFAAGIGGGYGSSASSIEINGGTVVALGSGGGAGIGAGRGTSKAAQYNADKYVANIKIGGDADVTAITANSRTKEFNGGGAAIGTGRGSHTGGNIEISGTAKVVAVSASESPAIGASSQKSPVDGALPHAESIVIGDKVTLYAVSMGAYAVDKDAAELSINDKYFGSSDRYFFGEDASAIADINDVTAESTKGERHYTVPEGSVSLWANIDPAEDPDEPTEPATDPVEPTEPATEPTEPTEPATDPTEPAQPGTEPETEPATEPVVQKTTLGIVTPLAMAVRFEDGNVYYTGDTVEVEIGREYKFQMCCVDWSTRDANGEKKIHKPYEVFTPEHGVYSDEGLGLRGTVVYTVRISDKYDERSYDAENHYFVLPKGDRVLRTDVNKCFMAYKFHFIGGDYNKQTGIDNVVYDTGKEHENTLEDFQYNKPLESLSVNLPLGSTITAKAYVNLGYVGQDDAFISIDEANPDLCYKDIYWSKQYTLGYEK